MSSSQNSHPEETLSDEKLERVFRQIEEASERRALEEEADSHPSPLDPFVSTLSNAELAKKRRRQSISVSRVGSYPDVPAELQRTTSGTASPLPWSPPPLCRVNTRSSSTSSLATASSFTSSHARQHEEENHTTQKETIAGRRNTLTKAMSSAFSKTLTRIRSRGGLNEVPSDDSFVIGVAVHEATTEITEAEDAGEAAVSEGDAQSGALDTSDPGPSRRMSTSVSVLPKADAARSRSGSILRAKLPLRVQGAPADAKQLADDALAISGGAGGSARVAAGGNTGGPGPSGRQGRRLSYFAKALAQRLRRRKSSEESEKYKEKGKEKGKEGSEKAEKQQKQERRDPPAPIFAPAPSVRIDMPAIKSPTLAPPLIAEAAVPLPRSPSPRKIPSPAEIPLPPSPHAQPPVPAPEILPPPSPAMIPLPL